MTTEREGASLILYDGVCVMCNGFVRFILNRDPDGQFRFAPLHGEVARRVLSRHRRDPADLDTMYLLADFDRPGEQLFARSAAVLETCRRIGGVWTIVSWLLFLPAPVRDFVYGLIVKNRYRVFGKHDSCPLPPQQWRSRFIGESRS